MPRLTRPTIFESVSDIEEAMGCGYLDRSYGYASRQIVGEVHDSTSNSNRFPTLIWRYEDEDDDFPLAHQPNDSEQWRDYSDKVNRATLWSDMKVNYPKEMGL